MLVYRVERFICRKGPYNGLPLRLSDKGVIEHPLPIEDAGLKGTFGALNYAKQGEYHFGFSSREQLKRWFQRDDEERFELYNQHSDDRFGISVYDCDPADVIIGDRQVVFKRDRAQRISFEPYQSTTVGSSTELC